MSKIKINATYSLTTELIENLNKHCKDNALVKSKFVENAIKEKINRDKTRK